MHPTFVDYPINYGISLRYRSPLRVRQPVTTLEREALRSNRIVRIAAKRFTPRTICARRCLSPN